MAELEFELTESNTRIHALAKQVTLSLRLPTSWLKFTHNDAPHQVRGPLPHTYSRWAHTLARPGDSLACKPVSTEEEELTFLPQDTTLAKHPLGSRKSLCLAPTTHRHHDVTKVPEYLSLHHVPVYLLKWKQVTPIKHLLCPGDYINILQALSHLVPVTAHWHRCHSAPHFTMREHTGNKHRGPGLVTVLVTPKSKILTPPRS